MLSILIPVYNYDIRGLVSELHKQAGAANIVFEIRCYDDGSASRYLTVNRELEQFEKVICRELPENIGRSAIRNLLAKEAQFDYLLFLDCDSMPEYPDFISRYSVNLRADALIYGGRTYSPNHPDEKKFFFRWFYGSKREVFPVEKRCKKPYHSFQTNNFVIPKNIFQAIGFNEKLKGYGHEDTQFGQQLLQRMILINHIDNPLRHLGLENTDEFLAKTREGINNLCYLIENKYDVSTIRLARYFLLAKKSGTAWFINWIFGMLEPSILKNLQSEKPSLKRFDFYKLGKMIQTWNQRKGV
jgi:glycosyltransferase involved in cell wall biosynthesis